MGAVRQRGRSPMRGYTTLPSTGSGNRHICSPLSYSAFDRLWLRPIVRRSVAVFLFFGVVAVCGTYYVQALELSPGAIAASVPVGALATIWGAVAALSLASGWLHTRRALRAPPLAGLRSEGA